MKKILIKLRLKKLEFLEGNDLIQINDLNFQKNKLTSFKNILVETLNNNFYIKNDKKILIKGSKFDATNLVRFFKNQNNKID